ncbi:GNAT family N-acetyltransferase [Streptosporangium sp. DT93]|uniref:GNAT family N-acetyltransferase n=1 Tax=Streptosporangium sp. DT93 TaxID=3393428 RepID=UPI003CE71F75
MIDGGFDRLVDQAWPAIHRTDADGWVLRASGGVTKRANSVLPLGEQDDLQAAVERAEGFYAERGLPCVFSIGGGATPGLDGVLEARGYRRVDPTLVMTADLPPDEAGKHGSGDHEVRSHENGAGEHGSGDHEARGHGNGAGGRGSEKPGAWRRGDAEHGTAERAARVELAGEPSRAWLDTWWSVDGRGGADGLETAARILTGVPATYASLGREAVGRGVEQGEWFGIYSMAVLPWERRRGHGTRVLRALLSHARGRRGQGTQRAYLVVVESNTAATTLYERHGFTATGRYHYRVR